jgi:hypothetical protein
VNPWDSPAADRARLTLFRALASGSGAMADFAKDVVAGTRSPRDVLTTPWAVEEDLDDLMADVTRFSELPEADRATTEEEALALVERHLATLDPDRADLEPPRVEPRRRPVEDPPDDERGPFLSDAW